MNTWMGGEVGRGRATKKPTIALRPSIKAVPKEIKIAGTNHGMGDPPLRQATTPIRDSTTNHAIKPTAEGLGSSTILAQTIGVLNHGQSCNCCNVVVVCTSKGQGAA